MQRRHRCRAEAPDTWQTHRPKSVDVYGMLESQSRAQGGGCESAKSLSFARLSRSMLAVLCKRACATHRALRVRLG